MCGDGAFGAPCYSLHFPPNISFLALAAHDFFSLVPSCFFVHTPILLAFFLSVGDFSPQFFVLTKYVFNLEKLVSPFLLLV